MTGGAVSTRQLTALRISLRSAAESLMSVSPARRRRDRGKNCGLRRARRRARLAAWWRFRPDGRRAPRSWGRAASFSSSPAGPSSCWRPLRLRLLFVIAAPVGEAYLQRGGDLGEVAEEVVAELLVERGAQVFVAGGEAQGLDGFDGELAVQAQRALDRDLPVAKGGVGEDLRLRRFLEVEEGAADALDILGREFAVLLAEILAQRLEPVALRR